MPQYEMQGKHTPEFLDLPPFVQGYIEAAFFTAAEACGEAYLELSDDGEIMTM